MQGPADDALVFSDQAIFVGKLKVKVSQSLVGC